MSTDPERHLLRATNGARVRSLSGPTGMARMGIEERILDPGERTRIIGYPSAEGFVFVLAGSGGAAAADHRQPLATGDFLALSPGETLTVENDGATPLRLLVAFHEGGAGAIQP